MRARGESTVVLPRKLHNRPAFDRLSRPGKPDARCHNAFRDAIIPFLKSKEASSMNRFVVFIVLLSATGLANADVNLDGAYERVSLTNTRTGVSPESANRRGLLIMGHGHYSMMTMNPERRFIEDEEVAAMSDEDQIAYLKEWLDINGHTGRYDADDSTLTWYRDISENPKEVGTISTLNYERRDDLLVIWFTLPNGDRYDWIWKKL